jgi:hypothetical protein
MKLRSRSLRISEAFRIHIPCSNLCYAALQQRVIVIEVVLHSLLDAAQQRVHAHIAWNYKHVANTQRQQLNRLRRTVLDHQSCIRRCQWRLVCKNELFHCTTTLDASADQVIIQVQVKKRCARADLLLRQHKRQLLENLPNCALSKITRK